MSEFEDGYRAGLEAAARKVEQGLQIAQANEAFAPSEAITKGARTAALSRAVENIRALPVPDASAEPKRLPGPDFGTLTHEHEGVVLECEAIAPGLSLHDLVVAFEDAKKQAAPGDELSANPSKWPVVRGVLAVRNAIVGAIYAAEPTEDEVERAARAMIAEMSLRLAMVVEISLHRDEGDPTDWADLSEDDRRAAMQVALAALLAARSQP